MNRTHLAPAPKTYAFRDESPRCDRHITVVMEWKDGPKPGKAHWSCPVCRIGADDCPTCHQPVPRQGDGVAIGSVASPVPHIEYR